jgi:hypothetical protein
LIGDGDAVLVSLCRAYVIGVRYGAVCSRRTCGRLMARRMIHPERVR